MQRIKPKPICATESTLSSAVKPNRRSSNFVPQSSPDIHTLISQASYTLTSQAFPFQAQIGHRRTRRGTPFLSLHDNSSILTLTVKPGPRRTVTSPQTLSPVADAPIAATGAPSQSQETSFRFALPCPSQRRFVS